MARKVLMSIAVVGVLAALPCEAKVKKVPLPNLGKVLSPRFENVDRLFAPRSDVIRVVVKDERSAGEILGVRRGSGAELEFFAAEDPGIVARFVQSSVNEALPLLGLKPGEGGSTLEITIGDFWIESYEFGGPMGFGNFLAWGRVSTSLRSSDGKPLAEKKDNIPMFYMGFPGGSPKMIGLSASRLFERLAWEVSASTLIPGLSLEPDRREVAKLLEFPVRNTDIGRANVVFWLGFAGRDDPGLIDWMYRIFRTAEGQRTYQDAAIALARLRAPGAAEELEAVLTGKKKLEEWEPDDAEQASYLLRALGMLGVKDLAAKIPATRNLRSEIEELVRLQETGEMPTMSPGEKTAFERAKAERK